MTHKYASIVFLILVCIFAAVGCGSGKTANGAASTTATPSDSASGQLEFVYVLGTGGQLAGYSIGAQGSLSPIPGSPWQIPDTPNQILRDGNVLLFTTSGEYTANGYTFLDPTEQKVLSYTIDPNDGSLTPAASVALNEDGTSRIAQWATTNSSGTLLYASTPYDPTNFSDPTSATAAINELAIFRVGQDGTLAAVPGSPFPPGSCDWFGIPPAFTPDDTLLFRISGTGGPCDTHPDFSYYSVEGFSVLPDGTLGSYVASLGLPTLADGETTGGSSVKLTPSGALLIVLDPGDGLFKTYSVNPQSSLPVTGSGSSSLASGVLTFIGAFPFPTTNTYVQYMGKPQMDATGRFLLFSSEAGSLGIYSIKSDGSIVAVAGSPFPVNLVPTELYAFSTTSKYALAVDANNNLLAFVVDASTGALSPVSSVTLPSEPQGGLYTWRTLIAGGR